MRFLTLIKFAFTASLHIFSGHLDCGRDVEGSGFKRGEP
jgi:hypothetical protein